MLSNECKTFFPISRLYIPTVERIKEEMEVQRGMDIIEKVDPPTETQPRNDRTSITKKFKFCLD